MNDQSPRKKIATARNLICLLLALIPFVCLIYFVAKYKVEVPYMDQWELVPLLEKSYQGTLSFTDLWAQHNEHRPFFPVIIMIALARFSNWRILYEFAINILLGIGIFLTITYQLKRTDEAINKHRACWLVPIISLVIFSLNQYENWLWGWQIQVFLNVLTVAAGIVLLANYAEKWLCFALASIMGVIGIYSFANGVIYWFIGLFVLFFVSHPDRKNKIFKIIAWMVVSSITICTYMYKYQKPDYHPPLLFFVKNPAEYIKFVLAYLGTPICSYQLKTAILFGLFGLIVSAFMMWLLIRVQHIKFSVLVPYIAFGFYSIGSAMITGIGRVGYGYAQALRSRYATISYLLWISVIMFFYLFANSKMANERRRDVLSKQLSKKSHIRHRRYLRKTQQTRARNIRLKYKTILKRYAILSVMTIFILCVVLNSVIATRYFISFHSWLIPARNELRGAAENDKLLKHLYPRPPVVKARRAVLKKYKLSVFRDSEQ